MTYVTELLQDTVRRIERHLRAFEVKKDEYMIKACKQRIDELKMAIEKLKVEERV